MVIAVARSDKPSSVAVELGGQRFSVTSDATPERMREVVDYVNDQLRRLNQGRKALDTERAALLVALNTAEALFKERDAHATTKAEVRTRTGRLLGTLDEVSKELGLDSASHLGGLLP